MPNKITKTVDLKALLASTDLWPIRYIKICFVNVELLEMIGYIEGHEVKLIDFIYYTIS